MRAVAMRARLRGFTGEELRDAVQSGRSADPRDRPVRSRPWCAAGDVRLALDRCRDGRRACPEQPLGDEDRPAPQAERPTDLLDGMPDELAEVLRLRYGLGDPLAVPMPRRVVGERSA